MLFPINMRPQLRSQWFLVIRYKPKREARGTASSKVKAPSPWELMSHHKVPWVPDTELQDFACFGLTSVPSLLSVPPFLPFGMGNVYFVLLYAESM
jgi:hypothetical protein